jgi:uncharacterized membrane protein YphA (DoxX/SURF4 family)
MASARGTSERPDLSLIALRLLAFMIGVFFLGMGLNKLAWLTDTDLLSRRFVTWLPMAAPYARWYLEEIAIPGAPVFARVVPVAELCAATALILGIRIDVVSAIALVMVVNFHLATSAFSSWAFLRDGTGPPLLGALLALALAGRHLPYCIGVRPPSHHHTQGGLTPTGV